MMRHPGFSLVAAALWQLSVWMLPAASTAWKGGSGVDWANAVNWTNGIPTASVSVFFVTNGVVQSAGTNNRVHPGARIESLNYVHTNVVAGNHHHHTWLNEGISLTVSNASAGNAVFVGAGLPVYNTATRALISGPGTLDIVATNGAFNVRQGGLQNYSGVASLDLSGLSNCTMNVRQLLVGGDGSSASAEMERASGTLKLARNNFLRLGGIVPPGLTVGYNKSRGGSAGSALVLGQTNCIFSDYGVAVGIGRSSPCSITFGGFPSSFALFRDAAGTGRQAFWLIGDSSRTTYSGNLTSATNDFSGGTVDALVDVLVVGRSVNDTNGLGIAGNDGTLTFSSGIMDVNTAVIGYMMQSNCARAQGTINVDGAGVLRVNHSMLLGSFKADDPTNGISFAHLHVGTRTGGGSVIVRGPIRCVTNALNSLNDSQIILREGGSLAVRGAVGPLRALELNRASLTLDFGSSNTPAPAACVTRELSTVAPVSLTILGTALPPGRLPLIRYTMLTGNGAADFQPPVLPPQVQGYLTNNTAESSMDLVITAAPEPSTNAPNTAPRLVGPVYADYDSAPREAAVRLDGLQHFDTPKLIQKLIAGNIRTYAFLIWKGLSDWDDFRLEFLPAAQAAGINVWLYLTPPSENHPPENYVPFGNDYYSWITEAARLSLRYPALKALAMDDFNSNLGLFTPDYVRQITEAARAINPEFMFLPVTYDWSKRPGSPTGMITPAFAHDYGPYSSGVIFPYLNWTNKDDYSDESAQILFNSKVLAGQLSQFTVTFPGYTPSQAGAYSALVQTLANSAGFPDAPYPFSFRIYDDYTGATSNYHKLQVLVDGSLVWEEDVAGNSGIHEVSLNLQGPLRGKRSAALALRMFDAQGVGNFRVRNTWIIPPGNWTVSETGAFAGTGSYYPANPNRPIPLIVMIYDGGYGGTWYPTPDYVREANLIAHEAVVDGRADGIIQYCLDKTDASPQFPIVQGFYEQWAWQPRFVSIEMIPGGALLRGVNGKPLAGYTLRATTNITNTVSAWTPLAQGLFGPDGAFTNSVPSGTNQFFRLSVP